MAEVQRHSVLSSDGVELFPQFRLIQPRSHEGSWFWHGQTLAFGFDKQGRPIHLQHCGASSQRFVSLWKWISEMSEDPRKDIIDGYLGMQELQAARMEESSERLGRRVTQQVVLMDLSGLSPWPDIRAISLFLHFMKVTQNYYPETLAIYFFVNTPLLFSGVWNMIKGACDPATTSKMHLLGRDFKTTLLEFIDPDQLPIEYGGTNKIDLLRKPYSWEEDEAFVEDVRRAAEALPNRRSTAVRLPEPKKASGSDSSLPPYFFASLLLGLIVLITQRVLFS